MISSLIEFAARHHGDGEIVSRRVEGDIHRYTWRDVAARSMQVAGALDAMGLAFGQALGDMPSRSCREGARDQGQRSAVTRASTRAWAM